MTEDTIALTRGTVRELYDALTVIIATEHNGDALVVTEVGLNDGRDVFVGSRVLTLRVEYGGRLVISGNQPPRQKQNNPPPPTSDVGGLQR